MHFPSFNLLNTRSLHYKEGKGEAPDLSSPEHFSFPMLALSSPPSFLLPKEYSLAPSKLSLIGKVSYLLFFMEFLQTLVIPFLKSFDW